jgi:hypothetical protein
VVGIPGRPEGLGAELDATFDGLIEPEEWGTR